MRAAPPPRTRRRTAPALAFALGAAPLLAGCASEPGSPAGIWTLEGAHSARMSLTRDGEDWDVVLYGGGNPEDGAGVAADCEVRARGALRDGRIEAPVVPFEGETISVSAADLEATPAQVTVEFGNGFARVRTDFAGCGVGADLDGSYRRER